MKGLFIPDITAEMFRNCCLESIEALMAEGEVYDIEYNKEPHWIPNTKETVPKDPLRKQIQLKNGWIITGWFDGEDWFPVPEVGASLLFDNVLAWCELPSPYNPESEE